jgi:glycosyltransferase involved in cell wall biosynthesis
MYSAGEDFVSIHKVHGRVVKALQFEFPVASNWFLLGNDTSMVGYPLTLPIFLELSSRQIKGGGLARFAQWRLRRRLARMLVAAAPDAVLIDGVRAARLLLPLLERGRMPAKIAVVLHGPVRLDAADIRRFCGFEASRLQLVAVSNGVGEVLLKEHPALAGRLISIPNSNDPDELPLARGNRAVQRQALGFTEGDLVFGAVGRLSKQKNFIFLVECFKAVAKQHPQAHLVILGEGEQRAEIESLIRAGGLEERVHLLGFRKDAAALYSAFDWLVSPSLYEGLSLVTGESLMAGVPAIVSDIPVYREQLGEAGLYAGVNDSDAWKQQLEAVLNLPPGARERVCEAQLLAYDLEGRWQSYARAYGGCLVNE